MNSISFPRSGNEAKSGLSSATQHAILPELGGKWETEISWWEGSVSTLGGRGVRCCAQFPLREINYGSGKIKRFIDWYVLSRQFGGNLDGMSWDVFIIRSVLYTETPSRCGIKREAKKVCENT